MNAVAISNNDMVYLHWYYDGKIPGCLGFNVVRHDLKTGNQSSLPAMVGFLGDKATTNRFKDTSEWPVQKFAWKDLFAPRGGSYCYEVIPMIGKPGNLKPDLSQTRRTNTVVLDSRQGDCSVYFNRGIISTQAVAMSLPKGKTGFPSAAALKRKIQNPKDKLRRRLEGDLNEGVLSLLKRAQKEGGTCYCASMNSLTRNWSIAFVHSAKMFILCCQTPATIRTREAVMATTPIKMPDGTSTITRST